jgi:hypothetical protein
MLRVATLLKGDCLSMEKLAFLLRGSTAVRGWILTIVVRIPVMISKKVLHMIIPIL